jgi:hypothetical protein
VLHSNHVHFGVSYLMGPITSNSRVRITYSSVVESELDFTTSLVEWTSERETTFLDDSHVNVAGARFNRTLRKNSFVF